MKEIIKELNDNGFEAYIVGGYVRDYLLGIVSTDIDISTNAPIKDIMRIFKGRGTAFKQYYAFHIEENGFSYDITSYRKELTYRRNKPTEIVPAKSLEEDILRRDFTINTFAIDSNDKLIDILGAKKDLNAGLIRVVGDTEKKLSEDKTRIIRALRFACTLDFELDPQILDFISSKKSHLLNEVPREYKKKELDKIFDSRNLYRFFYLINRYGLKKFFNIDNIDHIKETYNRYGIWSQIETDLPFTKEEEFIINNIKRIVNTGGIHFLEINKLSDDIIYNAASILGIEDKIRIVKESFKLHSIIDIDIDIMQMIKYVDVHDIKRVYREIERSIMEGYLQNSWEDIEYYLKTM